jgi:hypothetical protein
MTKVHHGDAVTYQLRDLVKGKFFCFVGTCAMAITSLNDTCSRSMVSDQNLFSATNPGPSGSSESPPLARQWGLPLTICIPVHIMRMYMSVPSVSRIASGFGNHFRIQGASEHEEFFPNGTKKQHLGNPKTL